MEKNTIYREIHFKNSNIFPVSIYKSNTISDVLNEIPKHFHEEIEIILFEEGGVIYEIDGVPYKTEEETILIMNKDTIHSGIVYNFSKHKNYVFIFNLSLLESLPNDYFSNQYIFPIINKEVFLPKIINRNTELFHTLKNILIEIYENFKNEEICYEISIKSLLFKFIAHLYKANLMKTLGSDLENKKENFYVEKIISFIENNFNKEISRIDLIDFLKISDSKLTRIFKKRFETNFSIYLNNYRIYKSANLLLYTNLSITDIAYDCGFKDISYFIRVFKKIIGVAPSKYRKNKLLLYL